MPIVKVKSTSQSCVPRQRVATTTRGGLVKSCMGWLAPTLCHKRQQLSTQRREAVTFAELGLIFCHRQYWPDVQLKKATVSAWPVLMFTPGQQQLHGQDWLRHSAAFSRSVTSRA